MKKFNPLVSIIIPVYNGANFVEEAINSALAQTYKNIEVIVVNDGSSDNTEEIVKKFKSVRYFKKKNGGVSTALNLGIEKANGQFFSWLSHDDLYNSNKLELQIELLSRLDENIRLTTIVYSNYESINQKGERLGISEFEKQFSEEKLNFPLFPILNGLIHGCSLLIPIKCFKEIGLFDPKLRATQDYTLWFSMFPKYNVRFLKEATIKSRVHGNQDSKKVASNVECDTLWINMVNNVSKKDMLFMSGSVKSFFLNTLNIVKNAGYTGAVEFLEQKINNFKGRDPRDILVSIIIPFYNRVNYTLEALESAQSQTHEKLEILLVDDGSTESILPLKTAIKNDSRVKLIRSKHKGSAHARNVALDEVTGEYIAFLDSDDLFKEDKIEKQLDYMLSKDLMITHTSYDLFDESGFVERLNVGKFDYKFPDIISSCGIATPTVMLNSELLLDKSNRFPEDMEYSEDICFWILLTRNNVIKGIDESYSKVRKHENRAADNPYIQIVGLRNRLDFVGKNLLTDTTKPQLKILNDLILKTVNSTYKLSETGNDHLNNDVISNGGKKQLLKRALAKIARYLPFYRKLRYIEDQMNISRDKIDSLLQKIDYSIQEKENLIYEYKKQLKESENQLLNINFKNYSKLNYSYVNINGETLLLDDVHKSKTVKYNIDLVEYLKELRKFIIKTDVLLDIGCGIRPQTFFEPIVHICIEPYKVYRDVIKPFFPNQKSHYIFLKQDALESLKTFDDASVDTIIMLDVIEHLKKEEGLVLLKEADRVARKQIIVFTPLGFYPQHYDEKRIYDGWGLDGTQFQEHKSGWLPKDFGEDWDFHICVDGHEADDPKEKAQGKRYSALTAIKTKKFYGFPIQKNTPNFITNINKIKK